MTPPTPNRPADTRRLTFSQIRDAVDVRIEELVVPEWGGSIVIQSATMADLEHIAAQARVNRGGGQVEIDQNRYNRALLRYCVIDPVLSEAEITELFNSKRALTLMTIITAIKRLNEQTEEAATDAETAFRDRPGPGAVVRPGPALGLSERGLAEGRDAGPSLDRVESV